MPYYRAVIDDVVTSYSDRITSHKSAWPRMQRCMVQDYFDAMPSGSDACKLVTSKDSIDFVEDAAVWLVSHPMEFNGEVYNLFGGLDENVVERIMRFVEFKGARFSLERRMPMIGSILRSRDKTGEWSAWFDSVDAACVQTGFLTHREILEWTKPIEHVVLGDSHSIAHYQSGALVSRTDGLTLHGLLNTGLWSSLQQVIDHPIKKLTICAGNIDIRHHLLRQSDWKEAVEYLVDRLDVQVRWLRDNGWIEECEVVAPLPIECEERKIPKTGWYKGTPFCGSVEDRDSVRDHFWNQLCLYGAFGVWDVYNWPRAWYLDSYWYADERMEKPGSVHLSPAWHRWDYENNVPNARLIEEYK